MRRVHSKIDNRYYDAKDMLTKAFKLIRKQKIIARQNFSCCGSCASYDIGASITEKRNLGKKLPIGAVFYSRQGEEQFKRTGKVYLNFMPADSSLKGDEHDEETKKVGLIVTDTLRSVGLNVVWNGDSHMTIQTGLWNEEELAVINH